MLCELRVILSHPEDVAKWLAGEATTELVKVLADDGRRGVLGMTDGTETAYMWFRGRKHPRPLTRGYLARQWSGGNLRLFAPNVDIDPDDVLWDDED